MLYSILKPLIWIVLKVLFWFKVEGKPSKRDLPQGKLVICANHISMFDVVLLIATFDRKISFMAKKELFENGFMKWLLEQYDAFPIDRENLDREALRNASQVLKDENVLGIFPEGTRIKNIEDRSRANFNNGIAMIAYKDMADILPVTIEGNYKLFSGVKVIYHDLIKIDSFEAENKKELYEKIVDRIYYKIYGDIS